MGLVQRTVLHTALQMISFSSPMGVDTIHPWLVTSFEYGRGLVMCTTRPAHTELRRRSGSLRPDIRA
jgi:hypothetical protein